MTRESWGQFPAPGTVRFERRLPGPIERVWSYFADSELRGQWLAPGPLQARVGGTLELGFKHSELSPEPYDAPDGRGGYRADTSALDGAWDLHVIARDSGGAVFEADRRMVRP